MTEQGTLFDDAAPIENPDAEYAAFVEKFKPKKTTDDCYTPPPVYDAVADWVAAEYGLDRRSFVRPFYPGGDYESFNYPPGCAVVDNPPFSILSKIADFYAFRDIPFFLFAPALTVFNIKSGCAVCAYVDIIYENGAKVRTSFLTNMDPARARTAPKLTAAVQKASDEYARRLKGALPPVYEYPPEVITAAVLGRYSYRGIDLKIMPGECAFIRALDEQCSKGKKIFGGGLLLSSMKAAEVVKAKAEAARAAAAMEAKELSKGPRVEWGLSEREREMVEALGGG